MRKILSEFFKRKQDDFEKVASELKSRATLLAQLNDAHAIGNDEVVHSIAQFIHVLGKANKTGTRLTFAVLLLSLLSIGLIFFQISDTEKIVQVQNNISLNAEFFNNPNNTAIIDALENGESILIKNHGKYTATQLDNYLGDFDTIDDAYMNHQLSIESLCDSFSHYIEMTEGNPEVQDYIKEQRKIEPAYFGGLDELYEIVTQSDHSVCQK